MVLFQGRTNSLTVFNATSATSSLLILQESEGERRDWKRREKRSVSLIFLRIIPRSGSANCRHPPLAPLLVCLQRSRISLVASYPLINLGKARRGGRRNFVRANPHDTDSISRTIGQRYKLRQQQQQQPIIRSKQHPCACVTVFSLTI